MPMLGQVTDCESGSGSWPNAIIKHACIRLTLPATCRILSGTCTGKESSTPGRLSWTSHRRASP